MRERGATEQRAACHMVTNKVGRKTPLTLTSTCYSAGPPPIPAYRDTGQPEPCVIFSGSLTWTVPQGAGNFTWEPNSSEVFFFCLLSNFIWPLSMPLSLCLVPKPRRVFRFSPIGVEVHTLPQMNQEIPFHSSQLCSILFHPISLYLAIDGVSSLGFFPFAFPIVTIQSSWVCPLFVPQTPLSIPFGLW